MTEQPTRELFAKRLRAMMRSVRQNVKRVGWHATGVFPDQSTAVPVFWLYTTGLWQTYQHPELMIFGVNPNAAHGIVTGVVQTHIAKGRVFADGERVAGLVIGPFDIFFRAAPAMDEEYPCSTSKFFYGHADFPVLQLVLPDTHNRFPWDDACEEKIALTQQLLVRE